MHFRSAGLDGVIVVEPDVHGDDRGFFLETYHRDKYRQGGIDAEFVQDNQSSSARGILRGLHAQASRPQGKLVRVVEGNVVDVAVDLRRGSATYRHWVSVELSAENFLQLYMPPGFAHGFCVQSARALVEYKCTDLYDPEDEITIRWNDPALAIEWPVESPTLSPRDRDAPLLSEIEHRLP